MPPTISMMADQHRRLEQHGLDEVVRQRADHRSRQECEQHAERRSGARADRTGAPRRCASACTEVDAEDGQDRAELDQHLERLAGRADAEEVLGEQDMSGRRYGQELGQALDEAQAGSLARSASLAPYCAVVRRRGLAGFAGTRCHFRATRSDCHIRLPAPYERCSIDTKTKTPYLSNAHSDALPALPLFARRAPGARRARHRGGALRGAPVGVAAGVSRAQPGRRAARAATGGRPGAVRRLRHFGVPRRGAAAGAARRPTPGVFRCSPATAPSAPRPAAWSTGSTASSTAR